MLWYCGHGCCEYERRSCKTIKERLRDYLSHGINVTVDEDNKITFDFHVIVSYGVSINTVAENLTETVRYKVEEFTGMEIAKINIYVEGVRVID